MFSHVVWICNISYIYVDLFHAPYRIACLIICVKVKEDELGRTCRILTRPLPRRRRWSSTRQNLTPTRADFNVTKRDFPPTTSTVYIQTEPLPWSCRATNSPDFCRSIFSHHPGTVRVEIPFNGNLHRYRSWHRLNFWQGSSRPLLQSKAEVAECCHRSTKPRYCPEHRREHPRNQSNFYRNFFLLGSVGC